MRCISCEEKIIESEMYWDFEGVIVCESCIKDYVADARKVYLPCNPFDLEEEE